MCNMKTMDILNDNDLIYIDTASLMNVKDVGLFAQNIENLLHDTNKKLIVLRSVCLELSRHLDSMNEEKSKKAMGALNVMYMHPGIFSLENQNLQEEDIIKAFADADFISRLIENKSSHRQLLITGDKKLSVDAINLNHMESCFGYRITVCHIDSDGELAFYHNLTKENSVVKETTSDIVNDHERVKNVQDEPENKTVLMSDNMYISAAVMGNKAENVLVKGLKYILIPTGAFFSGIVFDKYLLPAIKNAYKIC